MSHVRQRSRKSLQRIQEVGNREEKFKKFAFFLKFMKMFNTEIKRLEPIPKIPYDKMRKFLYKHPLLHFLVHSTYCRLALGYKKRPYSYFLKEAQKLRDCERDMIDLLRRDACDNYDLIGLSKEALNIILGNFYSETMINLVLEELEKKKLIEKLRDGDEEVYCLSEVVDVMKREGYVAEREPYKVLIKIPIVREITEHSKL